MTKLVKTQEPKDKVDGITTTSALDEIATETTIAELVEPQNLTTAPADAVDENTQTTLDENSTIAIAGSEEMHKSTSRRPKIIDYHREKAEKLFGILTPIQISRKPRDLSDIFNCECPRVYWPVCSVDDVTYVNACIANCLKVKIRRAGPCVLYRRINKILL